MNEIIRKLAEQAGYQEDFAGIGHWDMPECKKFAELIVRETLNEMGEQMDKFGDEQSNNPTWYKAMEAVEKYFGMKE
jgi:hypothetical protein